MSRVWQWIKKHPYYTAATVAGVVVGYSYWDAQKKAALALEAERVRRNREESERRDRERREKRAQEERAKAATVVAPDSSADRAQAAAAEKAVLSTTHAPDFSSNDVYFASEFTTLSLGDYKGKWLVIYFVPHEFTLKQVDHMVMLNENLQKFKQFSAEVVVVAPESKHQIKSVVDRPRADGGLGGVDFPIVSDINGMIAHKFSASPSPGDDTTTVVFIDNNGILLERQQQSSSSSHGVIAQAALQALARLHKEAQGK